MSSCASETCQSLQMVDRKSEYVIEAHIPCSSCRMIQIALANGEIRLSVLPKDSNDLVPVHSWKVEEGVHIENMTSEYKNETLFIRLPKSETQHGRPLQYTEMIEITPLCAD